MGSKAKRVIGTTPEAITKAEDTLGRRFPTAFKDWILAHNGLGIVGITIFPVFDSRDPRKTWDSITRNFDNNWKAWLENFEGEDLQFDHLLPFAEFGTGDFYCFDYSKRDRTDSVSIVRWSHETGGTDFRASDFNEFREKAEAGNFDHD